MAQHFRLSAAALTLDPDVIDGMSAEQAHAKFVEIRWADTGGNPVCPDCACPKVWAFKNGRVWRCSKCRKRFTVTSGTIFHSRKKPIKTYLKGIAAFIHGVKGLSAINLRFVIKSSYTTAFVFEHKLREIMGLQIHAVQQLEGEVEIDGTAFTKFERKDNRKIERLDRRKYPDRVIAVARERWGRTLPFVVARETDAVPIFRQRIAEGTILYADGAASWDRLHARYPLMFRVIHEDEYVSIDGASTNWCESYNARIQKAAYGVYHHIAGPYLQCYGNEIAWREDTRAEHNELQWRRLISGALTAGKSRLWCGYWQRRGQEARHPLLSTIPGIRR